MRRLLFEFAIGLAIVIVGLGVLEVVRARGDSALPSGVHYVPSSSVRVWLDPETGCEYFAEAWTPRLTRDGKPMCTTEGDEGHD